MAIGIFGCNFMLHLINTPSEIFDDSALYLDIYIYGLPFVFFYNVSTGIFSALGDSKTPFIFLALSSTSNIAADIWFVKGFGMGVDGVAWATFICQGISCILALTFVLRRLSGIKTEGDVKKFSFPILKQVSTIAIPSILQQSFISVGNIIIQSTINSFGIAAMAGYGASVKLNNLVITSLTTLANGISNFSAQNIGAKKYDRVKEGFNAGVKIVWMICLPLAVLYFFAGRSLVNVFITNPTEEALNTGVEFLRIVSPFYLVVSLKLVADGVLRGAGMMWNFMIATFTDIILRVLIAAFFSKFIGTTGIWLAWPISWSIATVLSVIFYRRGIRKLMILQ